MQIIRKDNTNFPYKPISIWDDFFTLPSLINDFSVGRQIAGLSADLWEDKENVYIKMAMPGIRNEDIKIEMHDDYITLSGSTKVEEKEDKEKKYYFRSMESSYEQSFRLPCKVDSDSAKAKMENGILSITLPKSKDTSPKVIKVE